MKNTIIAKSQGGDFGQDTRNTLGGGEIEPPPFIPSGGETSLADLITHWANIIAGIASGIAVAALIVGAIMWASSSGDEERISKAKTVIKLTIFGLILTLTAWVIAGTVVSNFG